MKELLFYRCSLCAGVVSRWDIETGKGCSKCGGGRIKPTNLNILEKLIQIAKHPKVWRWPNEPEKK